MQMIKYFKILPDYTDKNGIILPGSPLLPLYGGGTADYIDRYRNAVMPGKDTKRTIIDTTDDSISFGRDKWHAASGIGYLKDRPQFFSDSLGINSIGDYPYKTRIYHDKVSEDDDKRRLLDYMQALSPFIFANDNKYRSPMTRERYTAPDESMAAPFVVEMNEKDIVGIDDLVNNNFDAWRDSPFEYQIKSLKPIQQINMSKYVKPTGINDKNIDYIEYAIKNGDDDIIQDILGNDPNLIKYLKYNPRKFTRKSFEYGDLDNYVDMYGMLDDIFPYKSNITLSDGNLKDCFMQMRDDYNNDKKHTARILDACGGIGR